MFWDDFKKLLFLKDASDRLEIEKPTAEIVIKLEQKAGVIVGSDWMTRLDTNLVDNLGKYRKYNSQTVRDLMRVMRNKSHHFRDLPEVVQLALGPLPSGFIKYFSVRFPLLLIHVYDLLALECTNEPAFLQYFQFRNA